ncbi:hypothetical protein [Hirschia litorea]|uniref:Uncharacterized protein n=1 Tax=Hirschia litorea TaxID=1199156 RepID=A0ABW2IKL6_9PROT
MPILLFLVGIGALIIAFLIRAPQKGGVFIPALSFVVGLVISAFGIATLSRSFDVQRTTEFDHFVAHSLEITDNTDAPIALFLGASLSRNAIDDQLLTQLLREQGYPHQAINLSLQGSSLQERNKALQEYLKRAPRAPDIVFLSVVQEFDELSAYVFKVAKFSDRAIDQFDLPSAQWAGLGIVGGSCYGTVGCIKDIVFGGIHLSLNSLNVGLLSGGERFADVETLPAYDPQTKPREDLSDQDIVEGLSEILPIQARNGPHWAMSFRAMQRDQLVQAGVRKINYYAPPVINADVRGYTQNVCAGELKDFTCIPANSAELLDQLKSQLWFDSEHLLVDGARIYTEWLAKQIDESGALK